MKKFTVREILGVCEGVFHGHPQILDQEISNYAYMLNELNVGGMYFIFQDTVELAEVSMRAAHRKGALVCITDKDIKETNTNYIRVKDMQNAAQQSGRYARKFTDIPVIAVTGSVGKTSTKDMINSVLSQKYQMVKTSPSWNSNFRIAFGVLNIKQTDQVAVFEAAVAQPYDNVKNGEIVKPDIVVFTNIGEAHIETLGSRKNIFDTKKRLLDQMSPIGIAYLNGDDEFIKTIALDKPQTQKWFGNSEKMNYYAKNIQNLGLDGVNCDLVHEDQVLNVTLAVPGVHFVETALVGFALGLDFGLDLESIKNGIENFQTSDHRSKVMKTNNYVIYEDCYNSSPQSAKAALDTLAQANGRKVFIFGDMNRLGNMSEHYHKDVGDYIGRKQIDLLIYVGKNADIVKQCVLANNNNCEIICLEEKLELEPMLPKILKKNDNILIKGALKAQFWEITDMIKKLDGSGAKDEKI